MARPRRHVPEPMERKIERTARAMRKALLDGDVVHSPDDRPWDEIGDMRRERWRALAHAYIAIMR